VLAPIERRDPGFATAAIFEVDRARVEVIAEHRVVRREPLRER
jgi:hypothetical protein